MRALAWDDHPEEYLETLQEYLQKDGVELVIEKDPERFRRRFLEESWDFVVTDILMDNVPARGAEKLVGQDLAKEAAATHPVFVLTRLNERDRIALLDLPREAVVKTKVTPESFMAWEIVRELALRGLRVRYDNVFLIQGAEKASRRAAAQLEEFLRQECRIQEILKVEGALEREDPRQLVSKMRRCAAIMAVCTADEIYDGMARPGAEILLQLGMAAGLPNSQRRLAILEQQGVAPESRVALPLSLIQGFRAPFRQSVAETFEPLVEWLLSMRVRMVRP